MSRQIPLFINGEFVTGTSGQTLPVLHPATQELSGPLPPNNCHAAFVYHSYDYSGLLA